MSATHLHLIFNHLPIIGSIIGGLILIYALLIKSHNTIYASYAVLIASAIGGLITYSTGEGAEETVENIAGISEAALEQHEELAFFGFVGIVLVGVAALTGMILQYRKSSLSPGVAWLTFFASIIVFGLLAGTGYTGGQIRHTELTQTQTQGAGADAEDEDD